MMSIGSRLGRRALRAASWPATPPARPRPGTRAPARGRRRWRARGAGATPEDRRAAVDALRALGVRPAADRSPAGCAPQAPATSARARARATRANPAGLTDREVEVLTLVAEGLTNTEIGARLFVSPRTAGHHVAAILRKLDVPNRGQAAAAAARLGSRAGHRR